MNRLGVTVTHGDVVSADTQIRVMGTVATVRDRITQTLLDERDDAVRLKPVNSLTMEVIFADGASWRVASIRKPCGCRGGR